MSDRTESDSERSKGVRKLDRQDRFMLKYMGKQWLKDDFRRRDQVNLEWLEDESRSDKN
jgi:hypothetical protein